MFDEINPNAGLRSLAKLILNSFWGKFGQRNNQSKTLTTKEPQTLFEHFLNPSKCVNQITPINENFISVNWEYLEEIDETLPFVNVCIAAYTTTQARLKLYEYLEKLEERVLYYDTDSIIYISNKCEYDPPTGNCIGDMTDELEEFGTGSYINEFVSGGPKNYAYKIWSTKEQMEKVVCKVKGIRINYENSRLVNFTSMKDLVLKQNKNEKIYVMSNSIRRTLERDVITRKEIKTYRAVSVKRRFDKFDSKPYGYKKFKYFNKAIIFKFYSYST